MIVELWGLSENCFDAMYSGPWLGAESAEGAWRIVSDDLRGMRQASQAENDGVIVEYRNLITEYTEVYGSCVRHRPEEWELVKRQIALGELRDD